MILVSSCLAGLEVRYNGSHCFNEKISRLLEEKKAVTVCPELLGGFSIPRSPAELVGGDGEDVLNGRAKVIDHSGQDVTEPYIRGAYKTLELAKELGATMIILKEFSPSCGSSLIYNGEFTGVKIKGKGVTAALLERSGIHVISEDQLDDFILD